MGAGLAAGMATLRAVKSGLMAVVMQLETKGGGSYDPLEGCLPPVSDEAQLG